jgi:isopentenyldiphosphate isomerase
MRADELVDIVSEDDVVLRQVTRREMRAQNLLHRTIAVSCSNARGEIYVHRRTRTKDLFPGMYDMFVGGVVQAGESYAVCAEREIGEELGIVGPKPEWLLKHRYKDAQTESFTGLFRVQWDGLIRHQESEVEWGAYLAPAELRAKLSEWRFVPDGLELYQTYERRLLERGMR